jgi:hypothetical protein
MSPLPTPFIRTYPGAMPSVRAARRDVGDWFENLGSAGSLRVSNAANAAPAARGGVVDDVLLVVSELSTNAVEAAPDQDLVVMVGCSDRDALVTVRSARAATVPRIPTTPPPADALRGRGLWIVNALAASVDIVSEADHVEVRASIRLRPDEA